jgi:tetratricopeptide (TPR) repeat protein
LAKNDPDQALKYLERAAKLDGKNASILQNLAYANHVKGNFDKAEGLYKEALKIDEKKVAAWINLGNLHAQRGKYGDARAAYEKAKAIDPTDPRVKTAFAELDELTKKKP